MPRKQFLMPYDNYSAENTSYKSVPNARFFTDTAILKAIILPKPLFFSKYTTPYY